MHYHHDANRCDECRDTRPEKVKIHLLQKVVAALERIAAAQEIAHPIVDDADSVAFRVGKPVAEPSKE